MAARPQLEARSLSTINYLAANPPQYPYHPELRESLTLYISRVPGTQDVILSTFRPQKKSVTGEDITNALYYVHLDSPEDGLLPARPKRPEDSRPPRSSSESARSAIPRKPLPRSAQIPKPDTGNDALNAHAPSSEVILLGPPPMNPVPRVTAPAIAPTAPPDSRADTVEGYRENPMFQKRRSGPPVDNTPPHSIQRKTLASNPPSALADTTIAAPPPPPPHRTLPDRPTTPTQTGNEGGAISPNRFTSPISPLNPARMPSPGRVGRRPSSLTFSLTLIRRDPASGTQCNVGKVSAFQTNVPTPESAEPGLDPDNMGGLLADAQKIDIRLETSGYAKYRDMPTRAEVDALRQSPGQSFSQQALLRGAAGAGDDRDKIATLRPAWEPVEESFSRQVVMSYGQSWRSNFKKAFQRKDRPASPVHADDLAPPRPSHARHGSTSTIGSVEMTDGTRSPTLITHPGPGLKPKGYVFLSPWNGRCEFRTSTNGRSLKCRHILDAAAGARLDPREVAHSIQNAQAMGRSRGDEISSALLGAQPVSELRFNLPSAGAQGGSDRNPSHLSGRFSKLLHHRSRSSDEDWGEEDDDDEDNDNYDSYANEAPMDLSLGKEHAGGGNTGKRAKLGKLIIHDEGLKMLDLVVAANVGVWWTTWGRTL